MTKSIDAALAARLREESETSREDEYPTGTRPTHPNRSKVYSVRLSAQEQELIEKVARSKHLPTSTLVRSWILDRLEIERTAVPHSRGSRARIRGAEGMQTRP